MVVRPSTSVRQQSGVPKVQSAAPESPSQTSGSLVLSPVCLGTLFPAGAAIANAAKAAKKMMVDLIGTILKENVGWDDGQRKGN